jgi:hypothetical protein
MGSDTSRVERGATRIGVAIGVLSTVVGLIIVGGGLLFWIGRGPDETEQTQAFVDDLYLRVTPRPATRGANVAFFVQGEPPIRLKARRFADLLSEDGKRLFRLDTAADGESTPRPVPYPLPAAYTAPTGVSALQTRQRVHLPEDLQPGRYSLRAYFYGRDRLDEETPHKGTPSWTFPILAH